MICINMKAQCCIKGFEWLKKKTKDDCCSTVWICFKTFVSLTRWIWLYCFYICKMHMMLKWCCSISETWSKCTHTLGIEWCLSLELNCYSNFVWLRVWSEGWRIHANLVAGLCYCCVIVWLSYCHYLRTSNGFSLWMW